jgi:hypothetical protein
MAGPRNNALLRLGGGVTRPAETGGHDMERRTAARTAGLLFITATAAGVLSTIFLAQSGAADSPASLIAQRDRLTLGALMVLVMAAAIAMIPPMLYPILRQHNEALALGYVVARIVEVVLLIPAAVGPVLLLIVSSEFAATGEPEASFDVARSLTMSYEGWTHPASAIFFCLSVTFLNYLLFRYRLVPRVIAAWALLAAVPYIVDSMLVLFDRLAVSSPLHTLMILPLALNEMVLAVWLLAKGLRTVEPAVQRVRDVVSLREE